MTWAFFLLSLASAGLTYNVLRPIRRPPLLRVAGFFGGWVWGEAAPWVIGFHLLAVLGFALGGAVTGALGGIALIVMAGSCAVLANTYLDSARASVIVDRALKDGLGERFEESIRAEALSKISHEIDWKQIARPFKITHPDVECIRGIQFARDKGVDLKLDILRHRSTPENAPVLLQIHGGGWTVGYKENQALPLMTRLASHGWICVNVDYRLSPHATFPEHLIDCKRAIAWINENIARYGGDPDFIVATGGSAGGHLSSMVGLTGNAPEYQPGFEDVDTRVQGCVPFYGIYDLANRHGFHDETGLSDFLATNVMKGTYDELPELYHASSSMDRVHADAPPFFILHGDTDSLASVDDARVFTQMLRAKSKQPVVYAELPGAQHAFDIFHCLRSQAAVGAVERFAEWLYTAYLEQREAAPAKPTTSRTAKKPAAKKKTSTAKASAKKSGGAGSSKPAGTTKATKPAKSESMNGTAAGDSRMAHLPASKAEAAKSKPRTTSAARSPRAAKPTAPPKKKTAASAKATKAVAAKRKSGAKPAAKGASKASSKRKPKK